MKIYPRNVDGALRSDACVFLWWLHLVWQ